LVCLGPVDPLKVVVVIADFVVLVDILELLVDSTDVLGLLLGLLEGNAVTVVTFVKVDVESGGV
jgi:hypothetical protein